MIQLRIFGPHLIKSAHLVAPDSPRQAFYIIWIERYGDVFRVCKESGAGGKTLHRQAWIFETVEEAEKTFSSRIKAKANPNRRSRRKYRFVYLLAQGKTDCREVAGGRDEACAMGVERFQEKEKEI